MSELQSVYDEYRVYPISRIRCKTTTSIIHKRLENFYKRHTLYDYSDNGYIYTITHIKNENNTNDFMEIKYCQFRCMYDSPEKEISIYKTAKRILIRDVFTNDNSTRYSYKICS